MYVYQTKIKLHETDAAGLLFFSNQFKLVHDAYEALLESIGFSFADLIRVKKYFLPIVHCEADYKAPLFVGDLIEIRVKVKQVGKTSFTFAYTIVDTSETLIGTAETVHVTMDKATRKKIPLPQDLREKVEELHKAET